MSPYKGLTIFLDADVFPCSPSIMDELLAVAAANPEADLLLIREGRRAYDNINYVHGGVLLFRSTPLAHAFVRTWLRRYLVDYKAMYEAGLDDLERMSRKDRNAYVKTKRWRSFGSVYEQPALTETTDGFLASLGSNAIHWLPTGILARPNTGQLGLYRARVATGHPAAPLVHINPLKDWGHIEEFVLRGGCGAFPPFRRPGVDDWKLKCPGGRGRGCAKGRGGRGGRAKAKRRRLEGRA